MGDNELNMRFGGGGGRQETQYGPLPPSWVIGYDILLLLLLLL